jgi:DNA-binding NarL/FixJ family response regulator
METNPIANALLGSRSINAVEIKPNDMAKSRQTILSSEGRRDARQYVPFREKLVKPGLQRLSPRQMEVLQLLAQGYHDKKIAKEMGVCVGSLRYYKKMLFLKLQVHGRVAAMRKYFESPLSFPSGFCS